MDEQTMTTVAEPQNKPKRSRGERTKAGTTKGRATAAGSAPKAQARPAAAERVPVVAPEMPRRQPARPHKALVPAGKPESEDDAKPPAAPPELSRSQALQILVDRANAGNQYCLDGLRQLLNKSPEIWQQVGDLTKHAEFAWADLVAGDDRLMLESVKRFVARMKGELAGPAPTPVEQLLVQQVVLTWLASRFAEMAEAKPGPVSLGEMKIRTRRAESTHRRHLASIKSLAELRAYLARKR